MARVLEITDGGEVRFRKSDNQFRVALKAPAGLAADVSFALPAADGSPNQVLKTDGAGNLSFGGTAISGSGTNGKIAKFTGSNSIGDSIIEEASGKIGIGKTPTTALFELEEAGDSPVLDILKTGTGAGTVARVENDGTGICLDLDQDGNGIALNVSRANVGTLPAVFISNSSTGVGLNISQIGNARAIFFQKSSTGNSDAAEIENAGGTGTCLVVDQNGGGNGLWVDHDGSGGDGILVDHGVDSSLVACLKLNQQSNANGIMITNNGTGKDIRGNAGNWYIQPDGLMLIGVFNDAGRPAAGTAGRIIFNTTDGNLNIDNGTNWILPDGTVT